MPNVSLGAFNYNLGTLSFDATKLQATQAVDGIVLRPPVAVAEWRAEHIVVTKLLVVMRYRNREIARATQPFTISAHKVVLLDFPISAATIREIERLREGGPVVFEFELLGEARLLVPLAEPDRHARTLLADSQPVTTQVTVTYPRETWGAMLHSVGHGENVFVEVPIEPEPTPEWEKVYRALRSARDSLARGGEDGNRAAIIAVRDALEEWRSFDDPLTNTPVAQVSGQDIKNRNIEQRVDALRYHLFVYSHEAAHSRDRVRTRREAVLAVSTLAALLAYEVRL